MTVALDWADQIRLQMGPLSAALQEPGVYEVVVNRPGELWVETRAGWRKDVVGELTLDRLQSLARAVASYSGDVVDGERPILSATLPTGERIQVVRAPAVTAGTISLTIRKPSSATFSLRELQEKSLFADVGTRDRSRTVEIDARLTMLLDCGDVEGFLRAAVKANKNIIISGATGSGKTTLSKSLIAEIPLDERIITIEDTAELVVPHENRVQLLYAMGGRGRAQVTAKQLVESSLRMRPSRVLLAELRDGVAFYFVRNVNSGHPGSITTVHASSPFLAFEQLTLLVKESEGGRDLARDDIRGLLAGAIDVVVQCERGVNGFRVPEIYFGPRDRAAMLAGERGLGKGSECGGL